MGKINEVSEKSLVYEIEVARTCPADNGVTGPEHCYGKLRKLTKDTYKCRRCDGIWKVIKDK